MHSGSPINNKKWTSPHPLIYSPTSAPTPTHPAQPNQGFLLSCLLFSGLAVSLAIKWKEGGLASLKSPKAPPSASRSQSRSEAPTQLASLYREVHAGVFFPVRSVWGVGAGMHPCFGARLRGEDIDHWPPWAMAASLEPAPCPWRSGSPKRGWKFGGALPGRYP